MKDSQQIEEFKGKVTGLSIKRKVFSRYLRFNLENMEFSLPYDRKVRDKMAPLMEAFESGKSIEIEGKVHKGISLYEGLYKGSIRIEGEETYRFIYGLTRTFPRGRSLKIDYLKKDSV